MNRTLKILVATLLTAATFTAPAHAETTTLNGAVTAVKGLSLADTTVQLEALNADTQTYAVIDTATVTPSPAPTSTRAPYTFANVENGTYRVTHPVKVDAVPTSRFGVSESSQFTVENGKISVDGAPVNNIPDFKLNAMGKYYVQATDALTGDAIQNAIFTISTDFNGEPTDFQSLIPPNDLGSAILPIPSAGDYSLTISDPTGMHQEFESEANSFEGGFSNSSSPDQFPLNPAGNLAVTVTANAGKDAVVGATVRVYQDDEQVASAVADATGVANLLGLAEGDYVFYAGGPEGSILKDSSAISVTISAGNVTEETVNLTSGVTISGIVSAATGPVGQVRIDVEKLDADGNEIEMSPAESGRDGRYTTNGLGAGTYNLYFFDESSDRQNFLQSTSVLGIVVTTKNVTNVNALLPAASVVAGTVKNERGENVPDVTVQLSSMYGEEIATTTTDEDGAYSLLKLVPGKYTLKFSSSEYRVKYSDEFVAIQDQLTKQDAVLSAGAGIAGRAVLTTGVGIEKLKVSLYSSTGSGLIELNSTLTQSDGTYEFAGLMAGSYRIKYDGTDATPAVDVFWQDQPNSVTNPQYFKKAADIVVLPGQVTRGINPVPVQAWQEFSGTLMNGDLGIGSSTVEVRNVDTGDVFTAETGDEGEFSVSVPAGTYRVEIAANGFAKGFVGESDGQPSLVKLASDAVLLIATPDEVSFDNDWSMGDWSLDLADTGGTVKFSVTDETQEPVTEGVVVAYNMQGVPVAEIDTADDDDYFVLSGLRGAYFFSFEAPGSYAKRFLGGSSSITDARTTSFNVLDGKTYTQKLTTVSVPNLSIKVVLDGAANARRYLGDATVEVYTITNGQSVLDDDLSTTLSDGLATVGVMNGASYRIRVVPDDASLAPIWVGSNPLASTVAEAAVITIPEIGKAPTVGNVVMDKLAGAVAGSVTDTFENDLNNVEVQLLNNDGDVLQSVRTREDGKYNIYRVNPGVYSMRFIAEEFTINRVKNVAVVGGIVRVVDQTLASATGVMGQMLDSDGKAVVGATVKIYSASGTGLTPTYSVTTQEDGYYNFIGLSAGSYKIKFDGTTATVPTSTFWYGASSNQVSFKSATVVVATLGTYVKDIDPVPADVWTEFNVAVYSGDSPVPGAFVSLESSSGDVETAETDANGLARIYAPDGVYKVRVDAQGFPSGYVSDTGDGVILEPLAANGTTLRISEGVATFTTGIDLVKDPLDLSSNGGTMQVRVTDGTTTLTEGLVTVFSRSGQLISSLSEVSGGLFTFYGLRGDYFICYESDGNYARTFLGGTGNITNPATTLVKVRDKGISTPTIAVVPLPKFTVSVKSGSSAYTQPALVNVYQASGKKWELQSALSGTTQTGAYTFGVERGETYRMQVVPLDKHAAPVWVGSETAIVVSDAKSYTVPTTGNAPALPAVIIAAGAQVTVPVKNSRSETLVNVIARLEVTQGGKFVPFDQRAIETLDLGVQDQVTFDGVPISMFPIRVTVGSESAAEVSWTSTSINADVTSDLIELSEVSVPATVTGRVTWTDGKTPSTEVWLVTDDGDNYAVETTLDSNGNYAFSDVPLGVHFTVVPDIGAGGFATTSGVSDFTAGSGQSITIDFTVHYTTEFSGRVLDAQGTPRADALVRIYRVSGISVNPATDDAYSVYTDENGMWSFDGTSDSAEVGVYAFYVDGLDTESTPEYLASSLCVSATLSVSDLNKCGTTKSASAALLTTSASATSINDINLVLGAPDNSAPSGVKVVKAPLPTTILNPVWQWSGSDSVDGKSLRSEVVIATATYGGAMSRWSSPVDVYGNSYTIKPKAGTTYCFSVRMVDKSDNASAFTSPSCTTVAMDDTALTPAKAAAWSKVVAKRAYLGKVTAAKKNVKAAVLNVTKASPGTSLCIYYVTGVKYGSFEVLVGGKKLGKPVATAGKAGEVKSICYTTKLTAKSKISINVPNSGNGVQIDGYAITVAKPSAPKAPSAS